MPIFPGTVSEIQHTEYRYDSLLKSETKDDKKIYENTLYTLINGRAVSDNLNLFYPSMEVVKALQEKIDTANDALTTAEKIFNETIASAEKRINDKIDNATTQQNQAIENIANNAVIDDGNFFSGNGIYGGRYIKDSNEFFDTINKSINSGIREHYCNTKIEILGVEAPCRVSLGDYTTYDSGNLVQMIAGFSGTGNDKSVKILSFYKNSLPGNIPETLYCAPQWQLSEDDVGTLIGPSDSTMQALDAFTKHHLKYIDWNFYGRHEHLYANLLTYSNISGHNISSRNMLSNRNIMYYDDTVGRNADKLPLFNYLSCIDSIEFTLDDLIDCHGSARSVKLNKGNVLSNDNDLDDVKRYSDNFSTFVYEVSSKISTSCFTDIMARYLDGTKVNGNFTNIRWDISSHTPMDSSRRTYKIKQEVYFDFYDGKYGTVKFKLPVKIDGYHKLRVRLLDENGTPVIGHYDYAAMRGELPMITFYESTWEDSFETLEFGFKLKFDNGTITVNEVDSNASCLALRLSEFDFSKPYYIEIEDVSNTSSDKRIGYCWVYSNADASGDFAEGRRNLGLPFKTYIAETASLDGEPNINYGTVEQSLVFEVHAV